MATQRKIGVGVATAILKPKFDQTSKTASGYQVLVGQRIGSLGNGTWALPGGHLEFGESFEACARREVAEETGLELGELRQDSIYNDISSSERHYIVILMVGKLSHQNQDPKVNEPDKCKEWRWIDWPAVPQPIFDPLNALLECGWDPTKLELIK